MTEFFGICGVLALCSSALLVFNGREKELSSIISSIIYVIAAVSVVTKAAEILNKGKTLLTYSNDFLPLGYILKSGGVAIFGAVTSSLCDGVGQNGVSRAIETLTAIEIICIFIPVCKPIFEKLILMLF